MKTIFITIFEGVEGKNILRTDVLKTILNDPEVRVVLFTKSQARARYHQKEFSHPRILYEFVPKPPVKGLDNFFLHLKFILLRTETTHLLRQMLLQERKSYLHYYLGEWLNWILARPFFVRLSRFLDYHLVKSNIFFQYFDKYKPDLVFMANLFDELEIHFLREAKKRGVKTIGLINSWDRTTARCILRLLPDKLIAFNNMIKEELVKHDVIEPEDIFVSGIPHYDLHFKAPYLSRYDFFQKIGVTRDRKLVVYAPIGEEYSTADWDMIDLLTFLNESGKFGPNTAILMRFPPNSFIDENELKKRSHLIYDYPGQRFSPERGIDWDMTEEELHHLSDSLYYMSLLICYASSISIDAVVFDKPVINLNFEIKESELMAKSPTHYYKKTHYQKALKTGGICLVNSEKELIEWVNRYLADPSLDREARLKLAKQQGEFLDGKSGERIGRFILDYLNQKI